jgi:branched-chain amino acid transport system substrate-binding protein
MARSKAAPGNHLSQRRRAIGGEKMNWMTPRGPVSIDPETRDIVQNIYVRKVEKKDGALYNVEFETIPDVKDPYKAARR